MTIHPVLQDVIDNLSTGQIYELARGLTLSDLDKQALLDYLFDELKRRREANEGGSQFPALNQE